MSSSTTNAVGVLVSVTLTTALIKALIKQGTIAKQDVINELQQIKANSNSTLLIVEVDNLINTISTW